MNKLIEFINSELTTRGWGNNELARRAGLSSSGLSTVMTNRQGPGVEFCVKIARAFDEPPEKILRIAGLLPPLPPTAANEEELLHAYRQLSPDHQELAVKLIKVLR